MGKRNEKNNGGIQMKTISKFKLFFIKLLGKSSTGVDVKDGFVTITNAIKYKGIAYITENISRPLKSSDYFCKTCKRLKFINKEGDYFCRKYKLFFEQGGFPSTDIMKLNKCIKDSGFPLLPTIGIHSSKEWCKRNIPDYKITLDKER